jgi:hypothetical protein
MKTNYIIDVQNRKSIDLKAVNMHKEGKNIVSVDNCKWLIYV